MKKAIVIGASSGIGKAIAEILVKNNYKVGITGRRKEVLLETKSQNENQYHVRVFDVKETNKIVENLEALVHELGGIDLLIISAGIGELNEALNFQQELYTIETNIIGFTCIANWAFKYFENQQFGHLAAISSIGGLRGSRAAPAYNASKAFQINYLEGLRQKANKLKQPIYVSDIRPGLVNTEMAKGEGLFWVMPVNKAAKQIYIAIQNKKKVVYITKRWVLIAWLLKILPKYLYEKM